MSQQDSDIRLSLVALETKVGAMAERLNDVEKHQLELIELASFGKGSLRAITMMGIAMGGLAGIAIAIKNWVT